MSETKRLWDEVADNFQGLALKLKMHYQENASEKDRAEMDAALRNLGETVQQGVRSIKDAARDPAVKDDASRLAASLGDALSQTFEQVSDQAKTAWTRRKAGGGGDQQS